MTSYRFHFRPSPKSGRNKGTLFIRIIHKRKHREIQRDYHLYPEEWDPAGRTVILHGAPAERMSALVEIRNSIQEDLFRLDNILDRFGEKEYELPELLEAFREPDDPYTLSAYVRQLGKELAEQERHRTARAYRSATKSFLGFCKGRNIRLDDISAKLIRNYEHYLLAKGLKMNTVSFYMRNLRAIYYKAVRERIIQERETNLFGDVFTGVYETKRRALDHKDINALARLDAALAEKTERAAEIPAGRKPALSTPKEPRNETAGKEKMLREALMYFMFAYHSRGMSFIDLAHLKKSDVKENVILYKRKRPGPIWK